MPAPSDGKLLKMVLWFGRRTRFDIDYFDLLQPRRTVSEHPRYRSGRYRSEKCGREIQYESALERSFIEQLERNRHVVFYWDQPVRIPYRNGRRRRFYTPDYGIYLDSGHVVLAEVKELPDMLDSRVQAKTEALMAFCSERGFGLLLTDGRHAPRELMKGKVNRRLERELLAALDGNVLRQPECRALMERCHATRAELYKAVIRHNLALRPFPMKLQRNNANAVFRQVFFEGKDYDELVVEKFPTLFRSGPPEAGGK